MVIIVIELGIMSNTFYIIVQCSQIKKDLYDNSSHYMIIVLVQSDAFLHTRVGQKWSAENDSTIY